MASVLFPAFEPGNVVRLSRDEGCAQEGPDLRRGQVSEICSVSRETCSGTGGRAVKRWGHHRGAWAAGPASLHCDTFTAFLVCEREIRNVGDTMWIHRSKAMSWEKPQRMSAYRSLCAALLNNYSRIRSAECGPVMSGTVPSESSVNVADHSVLRGCAAPTPHPVEHLCITFECPELAR